MNIRAIYHDSELLKYQNSNKLELWFHQDKDLIMGYNYVTDYQNIEIFRSELLLIFSKLFFEKLRVRYLLNDKFYELKSVMAN